MNRIISFLGSLWGIISGTAERKRLEAEVARLHKRVWELQAYNLRWEMKMKQREDEAAREKRWSEGSNEDKKSTLKSRFNR